MEKGPWAVRRDHKAPGKGADDNEDLRKGGGNA